MRQLLSLLTALLLLSSLSAQVPAYVPTNGLVGWWPFNGNANDESGNGNNGVVGGATITTDRFGNYNMAYSFNGTNNEITVPDAAILSVTMSATFSLWVQVNQINLHESGDYNARLIDKGIVGESNGYVIDFNHKIGSSNPNYPNECSLGTSRLRCILGNSIQLTDCFSYYNDWNHMVVVFNMGNIQTYINGSLQYAYTDNSNVITSNNNPLVFGHDNTGDLNSWLNGNLDDIGIWNRALTEPEVTALFNAQGGSPCVSATPVSYTGLSSSYISTDPAVTLVGTPANGVFIGPGISGNTFDPAVAGEGTHGIIYTYLDSSNCVNSYSLCTSVDLGSGIVGDEGSAGGVHVYPNPNRGQFTVEMELQGLVSMQVFDVRGRQVHNEVFQASGLRTTRVLNLSSQAKGSYIVQVQNNGGTVTQAVVIE